MRISIRKLKAEEKKREKQEAKRYLKEAIKNMATGDVSIEISLVLGTIERHGISMKKIGTTEKKITAILREGYKNAAIEYLERAQISSSEGDVSITVSLMRFMLENGKIPLEEIHIKEEKIISILKRGYKAQARKDLNRARTDKSKRDINVRLMLYQLRDGGFSLEDIGTDKGEIEQLMA